MSTEPEFHCWLSVDTRAGPKFYNNISFSFVAEPEVRRRYSGIQLLLIQTGIAGDLLTTINPIIPWRSGISPDYSIESMRIPRKSSSSYPKPFLKAAFLVDVSPYHSDIPSGRDSEYFTVEPLTRALDEELSKVVPTPQMRKQRCYICTLSDEFYVWPTCSNFQDCPPPLEITYGGAFVSTRYFGPIQAVPLYRMAQKPQVEPHRRDILCVRLLPCTKVCPGSFASLPREILLKIGNHLSATKDIASASLVQKSWKVLMTTLFGDLGHRRVHCILRTSQFADAVRTNSSNCRSIITGLDLRDFRLDGTPRFYPHDIGDVISYLPNLVVLRINLLVLTRAAGHLNKLKLVEEFTCDGCGMWGRNEPHFASLSKVQEIIASWKDLGRLSLSGVGRVQGRSESTQRVYPVLPAYQLDSLAYNNDEITDDQLLYFLSCPHQSVKLQRLDLEKIEGIDPRTLATFLETVASTLVELRLIKCDRIAIEMTGDSILHSVLPKMTALSCLDLRGWVLDRHILSWTPLVAHAATELKLYVETRDLLTEQGIDVGMDLEYAEIGWKRILVIILDDLGVKKSRSARKSWKPILKRAEEYGISVRFAVGISSAYKANYIGEITDIVVLDADAQA